MRKTKPRSSGETAFIAPFPLKICKLRLKTKAERASFLIVDRSTEVYVSRINPETLTFLVSRGAAVVRGRLDMLGDNSTQVTLESATDWMAQFGIVIQGALLAALGILAVAPMGIAMGLLLPRVAVVALGALELAAANPLLIIAGLILLGAWRTVRGQVNLAREVRLALTDPVLDVSDLIALDDEQDGELVAGPPLMADPRRDYPDLLGSLLRTGGKGRRRN